MQGKSRSKSTLSSMAKLFIFRSYDYVGRTKLARQCTINSATGSSSPSLRIESVIISSFSTKGRKS